MILDRYCRLLELKAKLGSKVDELLEKEAKSIRKKYKEWNKQFNNVLFYTDTKKPSKSVKMGYFYEGLDPVEAVDKLIKWRK